MKKLPLPTLFLDRDGVLNARKPGGYIQSPAEFVFEIGVLEALALLSPMVGRILVVTNQAGIGKGLMGEPDLQSIHTQMIAKIEQAGGRMDRTYFCPHRADAGCDCRKPGPGMAMQARRDFPEIDFKNAWMVGDSGSDIRFGQALGMKTALISGKTEEMALLNTLTPDVRCDSLLDFAQFLLNA